MEVKLPVFRCQRCDHDWSPRKSEKPRRCGRCKSPYWDVARGEGRISMDGAKTVGDVTWKASKRKKKQ